MQEAAPAVRQTGPRPHRLNGGQNVLQCLLEVMAGLHSQPEPFTQAEEAAKAEVGIGGDSPPALNDGADAAFRHINGRCQPVLADSHWPQEFLQQHLAGRNQEQVIESSGCIKDGEFAEDHRSEASKAP